MHLCLRIDFSNEAEMIRNLRTAKRFRDFTELRICLHGPGFHSLFVLHDFLAKLVVYIICISVLSVCISVLLYYNIRF